MEKEQLPRSWQLHDKQHRARGGVSLCPSLSSLPLPTSLLPEGAQTWPFQ